MKKTMTRIVAVALVAVMLCLGLASCGKTLSGTYSAEELGTGITLKFDGKDVKFTIKVLGSEVASFDATYEIKDDKITFDVADEEEISNDFAKEIIEELEEPVDFEEGDDYIKIDGDKFTKQDD